MIREIFVCFKGKYISFSILLGKTLENRESKGINPKKARISSGRENGCFRCPQS